jgi:TRAP-type C4-dicarboxylate transport system permease small subunit
MAKAGPEYAIFFAVLGVLTAIGVPAVQRGQAVLSWLCIVLAAVVLIWGGLSIWRARN